MKHIITTCKIHLNQEKFKGPLEQNTTKTNDDEREIAENDTGIHNFPHT